MDKAEFIKKAPLYYALAILHQFQRTGGPLTKRSVRSEFSIQIEGGTPEDVICLLDNEQLWELAVDWLVAHNVIVSFKDPFGPPVLKRSDTFESEVNDIVRSLSPFQTAEESGDMRSWTFEALERVEDERRKLGITAEDFNEPEREWAPLPLDRENEKLQAAITSLDKTIRDVEQSNGYASEHSEERNFVLENLRMLSQKLKSAGTISVSYVRAHGLSVLKRVQDRFVDSSIGEGARETMHAIAHWLHELINYVI